MKISHIFIVGVGRSGTKFLMNVLNGHSKINISPETHCFSTIIHNGLKKVIRKIGNLDKDRNLEILVEYMSTGKIFGTFWTSSFPLDRNKLLERFKKSKRDLKNIFSIIIDEHRIINNKEIGGEKTPSNLYHVETLFKWFPDSKIIHIIRDPRNVLASEINKDVKPDYPIPKGSPFYKVGLLIYVLIQWALAVKFDSKYQKKFPKRYLTIRYEDLYNDHENTVKRICEFLEVHFEPNMLNPPVIDSSFENRDKEAILKETVPLWMLNFLVFFLKGKMRVLGYL